MAIEIIDREKLKNLLNSIFTGSITYKFIEGTNPCRIKYNEDEYFIYQKNLSPAQMSNNNPDIWRVQLPIRDIFDYIKKSPSTFVLLGYDAQNDVYATWNPYWTKQRLNNAKSVSFYSRKTLQDQAKQMQTLRRQNLNHGNEVIVFPSIQLPYFLDNIKKFFPEETTYVALGSRKRTEANEAYRQLTNSNNIQNFASYLACLGLSNSTINNYCMAIKKLINGGYFSRNRNYFLTYDSISDYTNALELFFKIDEIHEINEAWHYTFSAALLKYINFLIEINNVYTEGQIAPENNEELNKQSLFDHLDEERIDANNKIINTEEIKTDWEEKFTNENGKLTRIVNPELIEKLRPCLDDEYPSYPHAFNIIEDFYGDRFAKSMQLKDWQRLLEGINWSKPYYQQEENTNQIANEGRHRTHILRVTYPDGHVIQNKKVADTLIDVVSNSYPDLIAEMNIYLAGVNLVTKELDSKYAKYQREIQDGWLVMTNSSTDKKQEIIQRISDELELGLLVEQIPIEDIHIPSIKPYATSSNTRSKIQVTLPNGGVIYNTKVLETLLEVIKLAGAEMVRKLNIIICGNNLVLRENEINPHYETATKFIGNGWYVNTCSSTETKYSQIVQISETLGLNLRVDLV